MSILGRVADLFHAKTNKILDAFEKPDELLDVSYEKLLVGLQETKRHLADVVAQQKSLERQIASADTERDQAENDARLAVQAGRDDLARAALVHRQRVVDSHATLRAALDAIQPQAEKLIDYHQRLEDRIERFRAQKDTMKAGYAAAQAQIKVTEAMTGVGDRLGGAGETMRRAEEKMLAMQDKAQAMDSLLERGVINDPLDRRDRVTRELADLRGAHAVDDQLAALKAQMALPSGPPAPLLAPPDEVQKGEVKKGE